MKGTKSWSVGAAMVGRRLDLALSERLQLPRAQVSKLIQAGLITLNQTPARAGVKLALGDRVKVQSPPPAALPTPVTVSVIYEDDDLWVVEKPAGLLTESPSGQAGSPSVAQWAATQLKDGQTPRSGIVHRLDRNTSGLLIVAKHPAAQEYLQNQFRRHAVIKTYLALVTGHLKLPEAEIRLPLARSPHHPLRQRVALGGREALTRYRVEREYQDCSLVLVWPQTGRTHQIRAHFGHLGHPLVGDTQYGAPPAIGLGRHWLHASALRLRAPNGRILELASPLPSELVNWLARLRPQV